MQVGHDTSEPATTIRAPGRRRAPPVSAPRRAAPDLRSALALALLVCPPVVTASPLSGIQGDQGSAWFPSGSYFELPAAAPREPRLEGRVLSTDLLDPADRGGERPPFTLDGTDRRERQATAGLGATIGLLRLARWRGGGAALGFQAGVFGRFRLEGSANALVASDWLVALPVTARRGSWSGRLRLLHWSSHLGDEVIEASGAARVDFTFEALELMAARDVGPLRLYGGGSWVLRSQLEDAEDAPAGFTDGASLQLGVDGGWHPWWGGRVGLVGGLDLAWDDRTEWRRRASLLGAVEVKGAGGSLLVGLRALDGPSPLGQFYLTGESSWGLQIRMTL